MNHPRLNPTHPATTFPATLHPVWIQPPRLACTRVWLASLAALLLSCFLPALATTYHVSPTGSDTADGTEDQPFATLQRALSAVRTARHQATGEMTVVLAGGRYELPGPVRLDTETSGVHGQQLVIRAAEGQTPVLSGGRRIEGWTLHDAERGIYRARAPAFGFRQLYVNGKRAIRARHPNRENDRDMAPWFRLRSWNFGDGKASISVRADDVKGYKAWGDMDGVEIVIARHWDQHRMRVRGAGEERAGVVRLDLREPEGPMSLQAPWPQRADGQPYFLENSYAFLDVPGEWHLDRSQRTVFYKPLPGEDMNTAEVFAPRLQHLLLADGAHHVRISGLRFEHSTWLLPDERGHVGLQAMTYYFDRLRRPNTVAPAALQFEDCHHLVFENNIVQHTGASGVAFTRNSHHNLIRGNVLRDIAGNALHMNRFNEREVATHDDTISHNIVYGYGRDYHGGVGLFLSYVYNTTIEHNHVFHGPYSGISLGWGWTLEETSLRNNLVRYNDVHDVVELMDDGACLYTLSRQDETLIFENHFHELIRSPWAGHHPHYSLYFDQGSKNITAENNVLHHNSRDYYDGTIYLQTFANGTENITLINNATRDPRIIAHAGPQPPYAPDWAALDDNPPWIRNVWCYERDRVLIRFSEAVESASAVQADHYAIDNGVRIRAVEQLAPDRVELHVSPLDPEQTYTLTVRQVRDLAHARNRIQPNTRVAFSPGNVDLSDDRLGVPGRASARGEAASSGHGSAAAAFDGNKSTFWIDSVAGGQSWIQYDFTDGRRYRVRGYRIHPLAHNDFDPALLPADVTLRGSNDGESWTDLDSRAGVKWAYQTNRRSFEVSAPGYYSRYRLAVNRSVDPDRNRVQIALLELLGVAAPDDGVDANRVRIPVE
jgi:hypothetical protein